MQYEEDYLLQGASGPCVGTARARPSAQPGEARDIYLIDSIRVFNLFNLL